MKELNGYPLWINSRFVKYTFPLNLHGRVDELCRSIDNYLPFLIRLRVFYAPNRVRCRRHYLLVFALKINPHIRDWDPHGDTTGLAKSVAWVSLLAWTGVLLLGRLIPYIGTG